MSTPLAHRPLLVSITVMVRSNKSDYEPKARLFGLDTEGRLWELSEYGMVWHQIKDSFDGFTEKKT